jgi:hypothetical protein
MVTIYSPRFTGSSCNTAAAGTAFSTVASAVLFLQAENNIRDRHATEAAINNFLVFIA